MDFVPEEMAGAAGVELVEWPHQDKLRRSLALAGIPRILVLEARTSPPDDLGFDEAWVRLPVDGRRLRVAIAAVWRSIAERRSQDAWLDADGVLHRGDDTATLTPFEAVIAEELLAHRGEVVSRSRLMSLLWPHSDEPSSQAVDAIVFRLRRHCRELGIVIRAMRGVGFVMLTEPI